MFIYNHRYNITHHYNIRSIKRYIKVPKLVHKNKKYVNYQAFKNKKSATNRIIYNPFALKIWIWKVQLAFINVLLLKKKFRHVMCCKISQESLFNLFIENWSIVPVRVISLSRRPRYLKNISFWTDHPRIQKAWLKEALRSTN